MKYINRTNDQGGYIALLLVLIVSAVCLAITLNVLLTGTDSQRSLLVSQQSAQARSLASACAEEAMQQMHDYNAFTGTNTLTLTTGSFTGTCSYTVTNTGGNNRTIDTSSTVSTATSSATRKLKVLASIAAKNINIITWQDTT